jgi:myosin-5
LSLNCGYNFLIFLSKNGILFSRGSNLFGELGLGDFIFRNEPCVINYLIDKKEKISDIECGFKHVLARDNFGKVYSWGNVIF